MRVERRQWGEKGADWKDNASASGFGECAVKPAGVPAGSLHRPQEKTLAARAIKIPEGKRRPKKAIERSGLDPPSWPAACRRYWTVNCTVVLREVEPDVAFTVMV